MMIVDPAFEGSIIDLELVTYDAYSIATTHTFPSSVIDDLNDTNTNLTIVYVDSPDAVAAELDWTFTGGTQTDVITVN